MNRVSFSICDAEVTRVWYGEPFIETFIEVKI